MDPVTVLSDASFLPHSMDLARRRLCFLHCDPDKVRAASFIDNRADISAGPPVELPIAALDAHPLASAPDRLIFHVGFCGSTLLARLLDAPGHTRVLREPNILAELAGRRAALDKEGRDDPSLFPLHVRIASLLRRPWSPGETVVVKPSNWANTLLPFVANPPGDVRAVFMTMPRESFLRAVLRGGGPRLAFAARAAVHLSSRHAHDAQLVANALARTQGDTDRLAGLTVVLHDIQCRAFLEAMDWLGTAGATLIRWPALSLDPFGTARQAADALGVVIPSDALARNVAAWSSSNAKAPDQAYSPAIEQADNDRMEAEQGAVIERTLVWADHALGKDRA